MQKHFAVQQLREQVFLMPTPSLLSWCCNMQNSLMLSKMHDFVAQQLWHFWELGEERQQVKEHLCTLQNDLLYNEIFSTAGPPHPQDVTGRVIRES